MRKLAWFLEDLMTVLARGYVHQENMHFLDIIDEFLSTSFVSSQTQYMHFLIPNNKKIVVLLQ